MNIEDTNPADVGSAAIDNSTSLDNPENWNFHDPDNDGEIVEEPTDGNEGEQATQDEAEASENEAEQSTQEDDEEDALEDSEEQPDGDDSEKKPVTIKLASGEELPMEEVAAGYMKGADYTRKTQELGETRKTVTAQAERLQRQTEALTDYLVNQLPQEPDASLAYSDPNAYTAQRAHYEQQLNAVKQVLEMAAEPKAVTEEINQQATQEHRQAELSKLTERFPEVATEQGQKAFLEPILEASREFGFSNEEVTSTIDHRVYVMAHYAQLGMKAEKAKAEAKRKVAKAPKVAPAKQRVVKANPNAMKKLAKTGSIHDAVNIDFD